MKSIESSSPAIYIAGPLFNSHERKYLESIENALAQEGYRTFLPHRDVGIIGQDLTTENRIRIFQQDLKHMNNSDVCVALLTGADHDSGTSAELGYMYALGKPCFGITDDFRWMNNLIWGLCAEGRRIVKSIDELVSLLQSELPLGS